VLAAQEDPDALSWVVGVHPASEKAICKMKPSDLDPSSSHSITAAVRRPRIPERRQRRTLRSAQLALVTRRLEVRAKSNRPRHNACGAERSLGVCQAACIESGGRPRVCGGRAGGAKK